MKEYSYTDPHGISSSRLEVLIDQLLKQYHQLHKVLIIPPDYTRCYAYGGEITRILYRRLTASGTKVHVMPALGTHVSMTDEEKSLMFHDEIPDDAFLIHHWQTDTITLGTVPKTFVDIVSEGCYSKAIDVEVNRNLFEGHYDLILSVGQVIPHEVVGMANYSKNIFVGVGGRQMINESHMLGAVYGIEKCIGDIDCPVRKVFDYAQDRFLSDLPLVYLLTVTTRTLDDQLHLNGLFVGSSRKPFEEASALANELNITHLTRKARKVVAYLDPLELKSTWVGNKGIYRTRMIVEDGGELLLLAPGIRSFGESREIDDMIRTYGYKGRDYILKHYRNGAFKNRTMAAAHLIHGSADGRFTITYCTRPELMSQESVRQVGFQWRNYEDAATQYPVDELAEGWNTMPDGEEIYFVKTPPLGLWKYL